MAMSGMIGTMGDKKSIWVSLTVNNSKHISDDKKNVDIYSKPNKLAAFLRLFQGCSSKDNEMVALQTFSNPGIFEKPYLRN